MPETRVKYEYDVPATILKEGEMFVAYCPVLDLSTCGETYDEARGNMKEAVELFFDDCIKRGTLDEALASLGWRKTAGRPRRWQPPVVLGESHIPVSVPVPA